MDGLRGKVVLVDFWTYSCINCQRTFPFLRQWWGRYQADGLVIVGVHSPEFTFEKDVGNVRRAVKGYGIGWPVEYLIDACGHLRHTNFFFSDSATTERDIQILLGESGHRVSGPLATADT